MSRSLLTQRVNTYFAILLIAVLGGGSSLLIMHIANESPVALGLALQSVSAR